MKPIEYTTAPEIGRRAGSSTFATLAALQRAGEMPDAIVRAGRLTMPLFALPRLDSLVDLVNGGANPVRIEMDAQ